MRNRLPVSPRSCSRCSNWAGRPIATSTLYRWGADSGHARTFAAELVALAPDAILAVGVPALAAVKQATSTVPIVFVNIVDPVGAGFVESLARPGGNATGFTLFEYGISGKWLELLTQAAPRLTRAAVLRDPTSPAGIGDRKSVV